MAFQSDGKKKSLPAANRGPASADAAPSKSSGLHSAFGGLGSYGQNGAEHPASVVGNLSSKLADNLRATGDNGALDSVQSKGIALADKTLNAPQTRDVSDTPFPTTHGLRNRSGEGGKVPGSIVSAQADPVRKPGK